MPLVYIFTQSLPNESEDVAKKIGDEIRAEGMEVVESRAIDGYYQLAPGGFSLRHPAYTTASMILMPRDREIKDLQILLKKIGVINPMILVSSEQIAPGVYKQD